MKNKRLITILIFSIITLLLNINKVNAALMPESGDVCKSNYKYEVLCNYKSSSSSNIELKLYLHKNTKNNKDNYYSHIDDLNAKWGVGNIDQPNNLTNVYSENNGVTYVSYIDPKSLNCPSNIYSGEYFLPYDKGGNAVYNQGGNRKEYTQNSNYNFGHGHAQNLKKTTYTLVNKETIDTFKKCEEEIAKSAEEEIPDFGEDIKVTCDDLLSTDLRKTINKILTYIRILVPILVIVLGIVDFSSAVFSSKEEEMKKAQSRFVKRLIIAVIIFLTPSLINLLLDLANSAWKSDMFGNCGL